ncbi:small ribosomal subunit protein mS39 isoform X2 [Hyperolius riggenbachi]|uniref:small ribosomal subunit protein mS39 isoform X2 n=1 Tax=Hyperolius riggenbachi TaxID=752182 RepID=UPI0035A2C6EC
MSNTESVFFSGERRRDWPARGGVYCGRSSHPPRPLSVERSGVWAVMALPCVRLGAVRLRSGALCRFLSRSNSGQAAASTEEIEIPRKKTWDKTAVLQALAYTVNHDPTSAGYVFRDDPFLIPKSTTEFKNYQLSQESGRSAAKYIVNMYPNLFEKDLADPHIPCLMPDSVQPLIEGVCEESLNERIKLRRVKESVNLFDQLLQAGTPPSLETTNRLLDLLCFYGDKEPSADKSANQEDDNEQEQRRRTTLKDAKVKTWSEKNNAERIFNLMPEKNAHSFCTMIRGMVKHGAHQKAFDTYRDLLNNRLTGDVHTFNALISAVQYVKKHNMDRWTLIMDLINHMIQQKVQPNLFTFNALLSSLKRTSLRGLAVQAICEMRALNIEPSLATFKHLLSVVYRPGDSSSQTQLLNDILQEIQGKSFSAQDPEDFYFFLYAMTVCASAKDLELAYQVDALKDVGENWRLLGSSSQQNAYYSRLFEVVCLMENMDGAMQWYREHIPSKFYPHSQFIVALLQLVEMENRYELIPQIWQDLYSIGHHNKEHLHQEMLKLMAKEKQSPELQTQFANIAASIKQMYEADSRFSVKKNPSATIFGGIAVLLCRDGRMEDVWNILKSFRSQNLVPSPQVFEELVFCARTAGNTSVAIDLVQLAVSFSLPNSTELAKTVLDDFTLTEEQRIVLQDLTQISSSSSSTSSSDSDQESE